MSRHRWGAFAALFLFFSLVISTAPRTLAAPSASALALQTCTNLLVNSDMESNEGWVFGNTPARAEYVTDRYRSPYRSVLLGILTGPNEKSYSSMQQVVTVPAGSLLRLRAQVYPFSQPYDIHDAQELIIMDSSGQPLRRVWTATSDARAWQSLEFDISEFIGMPIGIYFNVYNDGKNGVTALYIDDVTLEICTGGTNTPTPTSIVVTNTPTPTPVVVTATPTPVVVTNTPTPTPTSSFITATPTPIVVTNTPTPTPTPSFITATPTPTPSFITATPTPTSSFVTVTPTPIVATNTPTPTPVATWTPPPGVVCQEALRNGGFESGDGWRFGNSKLRGYYTSLAAHSGLRSVHLGNDGSRSNIRSYSSIRQRVTIPPGSTSATLEFWHWDNTDQEPGDYQELILMDGRTERILDILWRSNIATTQWRYEAFDVSDYVGRDVIVYINVFNNGGAGRAAMWVDDVSLKACAPPTPTPLPPPPSPTASMGAPATPGSGISPPPTPTPFVVTATPTSIAAAESLAGESVPTPSPPPITQPGAEGPLGLLWKALLFAVIALIFIVGYLIVRQLWGRMTSKESPTERIAPSADHEIATPVILPAATTASTDAAGAPAEAHGPSPSYPAPAMDESAESPERERDAASAEESESPDDAAEE